MTLCVITAGEKLPEFSVLARLLAAVLKTDPSSAAIKARHCWGLLGSGLDEAAAAALAALCAEAGIKVLTLPEPAAKLPPPQFIKKTVFENGQAVFTGPAGLLASAAPGDISILAAAPIKEDFFKTIKSTEGPSVQEQAVRMGIMAVTGLPIGMGKTKEVKKEIRTSELSFYLDIILTGSPARLRLTSADFDFSGLREKKTYSSQVNFRVLCSELTAFAPGAFRNSCVLAMQEGRPLTLLPYDALADLEREELRLALAKAG